MIEIRRLMLAGGTLICAFATGYIVQNTLAAASRPAAPAQAMSAGVPEMRPGADGTLGLAGTASGPAQPTLPTAPQPARLPDEPVTRAAFAENEDESGPADMPAEEPAPQFECEFDLQARAIAAAMVTLELSAPCMINERFTLHHNGMMFTGVTDAMGSSELVVPALARQAVFIVAFPNGDGAVADAEVTSLDYYDRVVLQWQGATGLQIHALEFGAAYGEGGHVWMDAAKDRATAAVGEGGFLTRHGAGELDGALMAEVYSFPTGLTAQAGDVRLSVEAEVTGANCGRDVEAQSIQIAAGEAPRVQDLTLAMPECNTTGDFLVLKNLLDDLKIARQ